MMQGFGYMGKRYYRYEQVEVESDRGSVTLEFVKRESHWMNIVPSTKSRNPTEGGLVEYVTHTAIVNDCISFKVGDRIGDADTIIYDVVGVQTYMTYQQLDVKECQKTL